MTEPSRPSVVQNCRPGFCAAKPNVTAKTTKPVRMAAAFMDSIIVPPSSIGGHSSLHAIQLRCGCRRPANTQQIAKTADQLIHAGTDPQSRFENRVKWNPAAFRIAVLAGFH